MPERGEARGNSGGGPQRLLTIAGARVRDGAAASLSRATESRAPSGPFLPAHPGNDSVGGRVQRLEEHRTSRGVRCAPGGP
ncbi:hypothetical protein L1887_57422 [Cichorium endivia]|nr:hypothetical protein L1887_57422 [Cichorium endivia]